MMMMMIIIYSGLSILFPFKMSAAACLVEKDV